MNDALVESSLMDNVGDVDSEEADDDDNGEEEDDEEEDEVDDEVGDEVDEFVSSVANCMSASAPNHFRFRPESVPFAFTIVSGFVFSCVILDRSWDIDSVVYRSNDELGNVDVTDSLYADG